MDCELNIINAVSNLDGEVVLKDNVLYKKSGTNTFTALVTVDELDIIATLQTSLNKKYTPPNSVYADGFYTGKCLRFSLASLFFCADSGMNHRAERSVADLPSIELRDE